jgi:transcriptional regulator with XRE-family HTH domain
MPTYKARFTPQERKAFGELLRRMMLDRGMTGADLARRVNSHLERGKGLDRSAISWYMNGRSTPSPVTLQAIAKVLNVDPKFLLPRSHEQRAEDGAGPQPSSEGLRDVRMSILGGGQMHLMINAHVPTDIGWQILKLLEDHTKQPSS